MVCGEGRRHEAADVEACQLASFVPKQGCGSLQVSREPLLQSLAPLTRDDAALAAPSPYAY